MLKYKIIIAGAKNVGKSSLIARFCDDVFNVDRKQQLESILKEKT